MANLNLKKYQTQNFVNQYLQKCGKKYPAKMRKKALQLLKVKGFKEFEKVFAKDLIERLADTVNSVINTFSKINNQIINNLEAPLNKLFSIFEGQQNYEELGLEKFKETNPDHARIMGQIKSFEPFSKH